LTVTRYGKNEDFQTKNGTEEETKHFTAKSGWLHRFRKRFNIKNIKLIGKAASADVEAAATFPAEIKKNNKDGKYDHRNYNNDETGLFWKKMAYMTYINP
jgi:hypothetical protein